MKKAMLLFIIAFTSTITCYAQTMAKYQKITNVGDKLDTIHFSDPMDGSRGKYVDEFPRFKGDMQQYFKDNMKYPADAKAKDIKGTVTVSCLVNEKGELTNIKLARRLYPSLDAEAIRLVRNMPPWKPAVLQDKPTDAYWSVEVSFN